MDPNTHAAYDRIRGFLADLNLVLGSALCPIPYGPQTFANQLKSQQAINYSFARRQATSGQPTRRSLSWKKNRPKTNHSTPGQAFVSSKHSEMNTCGTHLAHVACVHRSPVWQPKIQHFPRNHLRAQPIYRCESNESALKETDNVVIEEDHSEMNHDGDQPDSDPEIINDLSCQELLEANSNLDDEPDNFTLNSCNPSQNSIIDPEESEWDDRSILDINAEPEDFPFQPCYHQPKSPSVEFSNDKSVIEQNNFTDCHPPTEDDSDKENSSDCFDLPSLDSHSAVDNKELADYDNGINPYIYESPHYKVEPHESYKNQVDYDDHDNDDGGGYGDGNLDGLDDGSLDSLDGFDDGGFDGGGFDDGGFYDGGFNDYTDDGGFDDFDDPGYNDDVHIY